MQYEIKNFESLEYLVRYPNGYESGKKYPVILHLHGAGGRYQGAESLFHHYGTRRKFSVRLRIPLLQRGYLVRFI